MARKTKAEAEQTYHALLDAAAVLFLRQGVARTTLHDIAREACMTRGAVYWHFDNKDAVIRALWERDAQETHNAFVDTLQQSLQGDAVLGMRATIKMSLKQLMANQRAAQVIRIVFHNVEFTDQKTPLQDFLGELEVELLEVLQRVFEELARRGALKERALPPPLMARSLLAYIRGLLDLHLAPKRVSVDLLQDGEAYVDFFLDSVLRENT